MRVLFLDLDTTRPDHMSCYGYHRNTTPNLDRIAAQGVRFNNYYCSDAPCLPARAALMSGQFGIHSGVVGHGGTAADMRIEGLGRQFRNAFSKSCLPMVLRDAGLRTATVSPFAERHSAWWWYGGFSEMYNTGRVGNEIADEVTPVALDWIKRNAGTENWFLHVNYWDAHTTYRTPLEFGNPFTDDPIPEWITDDVLARHQQCVGPHCSREITMYHNHIDNARFPRAVGEITNREELRAMFDGYDVGIRYQDEHCGRLIDALFDQGVLDDTVIIISADHGENMGELGIYGEHGTADHATCRIPMIIRWPGQTHGSVADGLHYNLDLLPTLADMLGQTQSPRWDGISFADTIRSGTDKGRDYLVVSQCAHVCQRSVRKGPWLYMRTYHDGFHLFDREMLFNIERDPHEQENLAISIPEKRNELARDLLDWHDDAMATMPDDRDPLWTVMKEQGPHHARRGMLKDYVKHLEATNRGWAIEKLRERHPLEF